MFPKLAKPDGCRRLYELPPVKRERDQCRKHGYDGSDNRSGRVDCQGVLRFNSSRPHGCSAAVPAATQEPASGTAASWRRPSWVCVCSERGHARHSRVKTHGRDPDASGQAGRATAARLRYNLAVPRTRRPKLGQHFLASASYRRRIANALGLCPDDLVIEIGAGRGAMTELLAARAAASSPSNLTLFWLRACERSSKRHRRLKSSNPTSSRRTSQPFAGNTKLRNALSSAICLTT